jgi:proline iminopeptidase
MVLLRLVAAALLGISSLTPYPNLQSFDSGCGTLSYQEYGAGKPMILLAGGPGMNPAYMAPVAKMLASGGRHVLLLHQRGSGMSANAVSCRNRMNLSGAIADLDGLRRFLNLEKITIAGHSWGGMLAMAYAQAHPDHVAALLLLDPGPMSSLAFSTESANVRARLSPRDRIALQQAKGAAQIDAIEEKANFADPDKVNRLQESIPPGEPLWNERVGELLGPDLDKFDVVRGMRKLQAPVTLIFGRFDPGFFVSGQIRDLQPNAKLIVVERAGHYPWLEDERRTAEILNTAAAALP